MSEEDREDWDGTDRRGRQRWRVKREVSVGDLIAFFIAAGAIVTAYMTINTRLSLVEQEIRQIIKTNARQDNDRAGIRTDIKEQLHEIDRKIDRLTRQFFQDGNGHARYGGGD